MQMDFSHWMALESAMQGEQPRRRFSAATLRRIAAFARPHRRALVAFLALSVVGAVLTVATPVLAGPVVFLRGNRQRPHFLLRQRIERAAAETEDAG